MFILIRIVIAFFCIVMEIPLQIHMLYYNKKISIKSVLLLPLSCFIKIYITWRLTKMRMSPGQTTAQHAFILRYILIHMHISVLYISFFS